MSVRSVLVLGSGSAGLLAALALKKRIPGLSVRVLSSSRLGIIGVGEGTVPSVPDFIHRYLGFDECDFFREVDPVFKLGIRLRWGAGITLTTRFVAWLEEKCRESGIGFVEGVMGSVKRSASGDVEHLQLEDGRALEADLFVDASGFRSELLSGVLEEPFESYADSLFCDRAVVGGWDRQEDEPVRAYTGSDTMHAGWAWRIDHPERVNRGYVSSSCGGSPRSGSRATTRCWWG